MHKEYGYCAACDLPLMDYDHEFGKYSALCADCIISSVKPRRRRLPDERKSITHRFDIAGYHGYLTAGMNNDGSLGEIFIEMSKEGSMLSGFADGFATAISLGLQYGVPLDVLVSKFKDWRFEPSGVTRNPEIQIAKSILDYIFRWLELKFLPTKAGDQNVCNQTP